MHRRAPGPSLTTHVAPPAPTAVPAEPPLFMVFDNSHPEVSPPGAGGIRVHGRLEPDMWITDAATYNTGLVEVVVGATGDVESAKSISVPQNVHEWMFLSAVKAWQLEPAMRDGQAVRYRQQLHIAVAR